MAETTFEVGRLYNRRRDLHGPFGGQRQGGVSTPIGASIIFLFTGDSGLQYGYKDGWNEDGVYLYTGEGQIGDMQFVKGNKAIRDHLANGKDLLLFENLGKRKPYRFIGNFACAGWESRTGPDREGSLREIIVFHFLQREDVDLSAATQPTLPDSGVSLADLRQLAYNASNTPQEKDTRDTRRRFYERSEAVRGYVLARANGRCEGCGNAAPFSRPDGSAYLEPHHIRRVSDGGLDDPEWVAGICPNCHREVHCGINGNSLNQKLKKHISHLESLANTQLQPPKTD